MIWAVRENYAEDEFLGLLKLSDDFDLVCFKKELMVFLMEQLKKHRCVGDKPFAKQEWEVGFRNRLHPKEVFREQLAMMEMVIDGDAISEKFREIRKSNNDRT